MRTGAQLAHGINRFRLAETSATLGPGAVPWSRARYLGEVAVLLSRTLTTAAIAEKSPTTYRRFKPI